MDWTGNGKIDISPTKTYQLEQITMSKQTHIQH